ncbi:hypothetical protein HQ520_05955 [bacterium]|nr:hypothetical protein [bacterium]
MKGASAFPQSPPARLRRWAAFLAGCLALAAIMPAHAQQLSGQMRKIAEIMSVTSLDNPNRDDEPVVSAGSNLELTEPYPPISLLQANPQVRKLLGENPDFIYDPQGRRDPMLIPWARLRVMTEELDTIGKQARADQDLDLARRAYRQVLRLVASVQDVWLRPEMRENLLSQARQNLSEVDTLSVQGYGLRGGETTLPLWVRNNTTGIIYDESDPMALVGPYPLRVGDMVPGQQMEVVVEKIGLDAVEYRISDKTFIVHIQEGE